MIRFINPTYFDFNKLEIEYINLLIPFNIFFMFEKYILTSFGIFKR